MGSAIPRSPDPTRTANGTHQPQPVSESIRSVPLSPALGQSTCEPFAFVARCIPGRGRGRIASLPP